MNSQQRGIMTHHVRNQIGFLGLCLILSLLSLAVNAEQICYTETMPETTPGTQFVIHGDGTVTDVTTALMWKQCHEGLSDIECQVGAESLLSWSDALQQADNLNNSGGYAGYTDWRVPNITELLTLVEEQCTQPAINALVFPATTTSFFWTSSPNLNNDDASWFVDFKFGSSGNVSRANRYPVRLVRSITD